MSRLIGEKLTQMRSSSAHGDSMAQMLGRDDMLFSASGAD